MRSKNEQVSLGDASARRAVLQTLCYSDIFDYALSIDQIERFLIGRKIPVSVIKRLLKTSDIYNQNNLYCLSTNRKAIEKRVEREVFSKKKYTIAKKILRLFVWFPTIQFIGISGSLALSNAKEKDDIDIFVITAKNSLWISRLFLVVGLSLIGKYRGRNTKNVSNKICVNMLIDETALMTPKKHQNVYTAHEIAQIQPLFDKHGMFGKFLHANRWVLDFMPNAFGGIMNHELRIMNENKKKKGRSSLFFIPNSMAKMMQLLFINKHRTTEIVSDHIMAFHPHDYTDYVLSQYRGRLRKYDIANRHE